MGTYFEVRDTLFRIPAKHKPAARDALVALAAHYRTASEFGFPFVSEKEVMEAETFEQALFACRWDATIGYYGDVVDVVFIGEKLGAESSIWSVLAPFVDNGSYIEIVADGPDLFRWTFVGGKLYEDEPTITWPKHDSASEEATKAALPVELDPVWSVQRGATAEMYLGSHAAKPSETRVEARESLLQLYGASLVQCPSCQARMELRILDRTTRTTWLEAKE